MAAKVEGEVERVQEVGGKGRGRGSLLVNLAAKRAKVEGRFPQKCTVRHCVTLKNQVSNALR